ncbi:MAG TPA: hypothetical protein VGB37_10385 [Candidatus Lokiarchaeia archaeon]
MRRDKPMKKSTYWLLFIVCSIIIAFGLIGILLTSSDSRLENTIGGVLLIIGIVAMYILQKKKPK